MITIRKAAEADCRTIRRLAETAPPAALPAILSPPQIAYMLEWMYAEPELLRQMRDGYVYYLASDEGVPCGYVSVERQAPDLFHLQRLYVLPAFQGRGIGASLFGRAVAHVRAAHPAPCRMELNVNRRNRALRFYERMGMRILREGDFAIGGGFYMNDYILGMEIGPAEADAEVLQNGGRR